MNRALPRVAAVVFGLLVFLVLAELGARAVFRHVLQYDVEMWRYAKELKISGRTPALRFEHRPNARARLMGVEVVTNGDGMRDQEHSRGPQDGIVRIAALGDSVTLGWGVAREDAYPEVLERGLSKRFPGMEFQVLNFGVGNYNTADELEMLRRRALEYAPDVILVGVYLNDAEERGTRRTSLVLEHSVFGVWLWGRVDALLRRIGVREDYEAYFLNLFEEGRPGRARMQGALGEVLSVGRERGIPVVVAVLPDLHRLDGYPFRGVHQEIRAWVETEGGFVVDLLDSLPRQKADQFWVSRDDPHPNARAHALYARTLVERVPWWELVTGLGGGEERPRGEN